MVFNHVIRRPCWCKKRQHIGHFRVHLILHFKARLSAKSLSWKSVFIHIEIRTNYHNKSFALRLALKEANSEMTYSWFSLTWWDGHVGVQNNDKMSLKFCIIIESNSQKTFSAIVLYTNMAAVTSGANQELWHIFCIIINSNFQKTSFS